MKTPEVYKDVVPYALGYKKYKTVLEIASGSSQNLLTLQEMDKSLELYGFDSGNPTEQEGLHLEKGDLTDKKWPFEDMKFDVVLTMASLILMPPDTTYHWMKKVKEITKDYFVVIEIHDEKVGMKGRVTKYSEPYVVRNYVKLLDKFGYKDIKTKKYPMKVWPGWSGGEEDKDVGSSTIVWGRV